MRRLLSCHLAFMIAPNACGGKGFARRCRSKRMFRRSGPRFADKNMRQSKNLLHI